MVSSTPRPYFTPWKDPIPIVQEAGWAPGPVWTGGKSGPTGIQSPDRPVRSQSLYRLTYPIIVFKGVYRTGTLRLTTLFQVSRLSSITLGRMVMNDEVEVLWDGTVEAGFQEELLASYTVERKWKSPATIHRYCP